MPITKKAPTLDTSLDKQIAFGEVISQARNALKLSQTELATQLELQKSSRSAISEWEVGNRSVPAEHLPKLVVILAGAPGVLDTWESLLQWVSILGLSERWLLDHLDRAKINALYPQKPGDQPLLNTNLVPRPQWEEKLVQHLRRPQSPSSRPLPPILLWGPIGSGKSTLIQRARQHPDLLNGFDGHLYAALPTQADPAFWLARWGQQLACPTLPPKWQDQQAAHLWLHTGLLNRSYLIILDDVQAPADQHPLAFAQPFCLTAPHLRLLITSSDPAVLAAAQNAYPEALLITLDELTADDQSALWFRLTYTKPTAEITPQLQQLATVTGSDWRAFTQWLAVAHHSGWPTMLQNLRAAQAGPHRPGDMIATYQSLWPRLSQPAQEALIALGSLPTLRQYPLTGLQVIWKTSPDQTRQLAYELSELNFLSFVSPPNVATDVIIRLDILRFARQLAFSLNEAHSPAKVWDLPWLQSYWLTPQWVTERQTIERYLADTPIPAVASHFWQRKIIRLDWLGTEWEALLHHWDTLTLPEWIYMAWLTHRVDRQTNTAILLGLLWLFTFIISAALDWFDFAYAVFYLGFLLLVLATLWAFQIARYAEALRMLVTARRLPTD